MNITFNTTQPKKADALVITATKGAKLGAVAHKIDQKTAGTIKRAIKADSFDGQNGQILIIPGPQKLSIGHIVVLGLGAPKDLNDLRLESLGSRLTTKLNALRVKHAVVLLEDTNIAVGLGRGALLASYRFDTYRTKESKTKKPTLKKLDIVGKAIAEAKKQFLKEQKVAEGVFLARDLVSEPPNVLYPKSYAARIKSAMKDTKVRVQVLGEAEMKKLGMGALLAVGQGSARASQLVVMRYTGAPANAKNKKPLCFVGKGVTFDTGGISLKPGPGMQDMKYDMGGSAAVVGVMKALAGRKAKVNAVGIVGLVENMPDGLSYRPGDILTSMSGQTIEVQNTDAEGRLVLCDALWYAQEKIKPRLVIDLATLTGAILIALGNEFAGCFSNDDKLPQQLMDAGKAVNEGVWHMPLCEAYDKQLDSDVADMRNIGGREAGSATAASFLQRYIKKGVPWAHLDIAGTAWTTKPLPGVPKGATGYGVRLLDRFVKDNFEK